jgi:hypothetical protein
LKIEMKRVKRRWRKKTMVYCIWFEKKIQWTNWKNIMWRDTYNRRKEALQVYIGKELLSGNWSLISRLQRKEADVWIARVGVSFLSNQTN